MFSMLSTALSNLMKEGFDVKALRAFRVLRPLRLVSGVPSNYPKALHNFMYFMYFMISLHRFTSCFEFNSTCHGAFASHCTAGAVRDHHLCNYRIGIVFWEIASFVF